MRGFARFEGFAERLIEGPFRWLLGEALQPVDIARRLARVMDDHQTIAAGKVFVPNRYQVFLHPDTLAGFASYQRALEEELVNFLVETAQERDFAFVGRPQVSLLPNPEVRREAMRVEAQLADVAGTALEGPVGHTQDLPVELVHQALAEAATDASTPRYVIYADQREIPLNEPHVTLGRALDNDVILDHPTVSRRHAQINVRHGRPVLRDLNSRNGTFVNGERVSECILRDGDRLALGDARLLFLAVGPRLSPSVQRTGDGQETGKQLSDHPGRKPPARAPASPEHDPPVSPAGRGQGPTDTRPQDTLRGQ